MRAASVLCLMLAVVSPGQAEAPPTAEKPEAAQVTRVIDGDTIMVSQAGRFV